MCEAAIARGFRGVLMRSCLGLYNPKVQVPNNHILTQNLYYNYYYPKPKYLVIGCMDPLGKGRKALNPKRCTRGPF